MRNRPRVVLNRRELLAALVAVIATGEATAAEAVRMSARQAHSAAARGDLLLIDIRSREEWRRTGIGEHAAAISMHEPGFVDELDRLVAGDRSRPVALICASGGRSSRLQSMLARAGFTGVLDVAEGMEGGPNGRGWIRSGLPIKPFRP